MPHTSIFNSNNSSLTVSVSTTYYEPPTGWFRLYLTEVNLQLPVRTAGTLSRLTVNYNSSPNTTVFNNRVATANGSMSVSVSSSGVHTDSVNHDNLTAGQLISYAWTTPSSSGTPPQSIGTTFASNSGLTTFIMDSGQNVTTGVSINSNNTQYYPLGNHSIQTSTTDGTGGEKYQIAGTAKNYCINVIVMGSNSNITMTMRKNSTTDMAVTVAITASTTGQYEDTINTAAVSASDIIYAKKSGGQSGSTNSFGSMGFWLDYTSGNTSDILGGTVDSNGSQYSGTTANRFMVVQGAPANSSSTENQEIVVIGFAGTWSNLRWNVSSNTATQSVTVTSRVTNASKSQTFSVGSTLTGEFTDAVNSDSVSQGDSLSLLMVGTTGISGNIFINQVTSRINDTSGTIFTDSVSEALSLAETNSATADFHSGISTSEALNLTETNNCDVNDEVSDSDALGLTAAQSCVAVFNVSVSEALGLTDTGSGTLIAEESHCVNVIWRSPIG